VGTINFPFATHIGLDKYVFAETILFPANRMTEKNNHLKKLFLATKSFFFIKT
jgi:hypothetical protein